MARPIPTGLPAFLNSAMMKFLSFLQASATMPDDDQPAVAMPLAPPYVPPQPLTLRINGAAHEMMVEPRVSLLDALRERLALTGTKKGCDRGQCGACTVLVDGQRINSCLTLAVMHDGREITTVEGLAQDGAPHPVQAAFMAHDGFQCGYCTPGQLCSTVALLRELAEGQASSVTRGERPAAFSDDEIRERMSGNLCRCGAYQNIVAAIRTAAGALGTASQ
jgi:xanthine dehydrogenase YagT iron-sulfur-binding subunit